MFAFLCSNRFEILLESLLDQLGQRGDIFPTGNDTLIGAAFTQRQIIVPSSAVQRRVELAVADRYGICTNLTFSYLAEWLRERIAHQTTAQHPAQTPESLAWRIFALFSATDTLSWLPHHPRLHSYLNRADAYMRFELASRISHLFEHYLIYRPEWIKAWATNTPPPFFRSLSGDLLADAAWQAALWQTLYPPGQSPAVLQALETQSAAPVLSTWPTGVDLFCLPAIPPLYLSLLRQLSQTVDIRLYVLNPCREFWFDIVDARRLSWLTTRQRDLFHETGNQLLASWGQQTQAYISQLFDDEHVQHDEAKFLPHPGNHLLAQLQNAILDLNALHPGSMRLSGQDRSIEIHICHSFTRELEVLHDRLLSLFTSLPELSPADILIGVPNLQENAPLIDAVFGTKTAEQHIPWRITGLGQTHENPIAGILNQALTLATGHFPISEVFDLLQQPPVAAHFGLDRQALDTLHLWIQQAAIHWGLDETDLAEENIESSLYQPTLSHGLDRLYLAWASGDSATYSLFAGQLGAGNPEGHDALILGRFWRYLKVLEFLRSASREPATATVWYDNLTELLNRLTGETSDWIHERRETQTALHRLADTIIQSQTDPLIPLEVLHTALMVELDTALPGGVPGGTVTFASLSSLRNLPYRVVCLIGLNSDAIPSTERPTEFDLLSAFPRPGDRQRRLDERNVFLDLILAAREVLHLSYTGRSIRDGTEQPPSILVDELLDVLTTACGASPEDPDAQDEIRKRLTVQHPLQAFSEKYFLSETRTDSRLVSFNQAYAAAHEKKQTTSTAQPTDHIFFTSTLPAVDHTWRTPALETLIRFFHHPYRFILKERLGIALTFSQNELEDTEPFSLTWQGRKKLSSRLLPVLLQDSLSSIQGADLPPLSDDALYALARAGGEYPAGALGEQALRNELIQLRAFTAGITHTHQTPVLPPYLPNLEFDLAGEHWSLSTAFTTLRPDGNFYHHYHNTRRPEDYLTAWITHLALCAAPLQAIQPVTHWFSRDGSFYLTPCPQDFAYACLQDLLSLYREGLNAPLPFFPKTAWTYITEGKSTTKAYQKWDSSHRPEWSEQNDNAYRLILRQQPAPLAECFELAIRILDPMLVHLVDSRLR